MYIVIDSIKYPRLAALTFAPETSLTGDGLAVNQFTADIVTADDIRIGRYARLYDDRDRLWAKYWISYAERRDPKTVRVIADSDLRLLDGKQLAAVMLQNVPVPDLVGGLFAGVASTIHSPPYVIDDAFANTTVSGYCPEQSARDRLQLVCMHIGAYVRSYASEYIEITRLGGAETLISLNRTYWRPQRIYRDWVTRLVIRNYEYEPGEPGPTDDYVKIDDVTWLQSWLEVQYDNPDAPAEAPANEIRADEMTLTNATDMSARLAAYWFGRTDLELEVINNGEYWPGDGVIVYADEATLYTGYIEKCDFGFGLQAKARLRVSMATLRPAAKLTVNYVDEDGRKIGKRALTLPTGLPYSVKHAYIDVTVGGVRTVYRPTVEASAGYMPDADTAIDVPCARALVFSGGVLEIISVDGATIDQEGVVSIE